MDRIHVAAVQRDETRGGVRIAARHVRHAVLVEVGRGQRRRSHGLGERDKVFILGNEIRLGIHLDDHGPTAVAGDDDPAVGRHASRFLVSLGLAGLAQILCRGVHIAAGVHQRLLAFHHAGAGAFT